MAHFDRAIPPGGVGKITLKLDTRGIRGKVRKSAQIHSNDPNHAIDTIVLEAQIKPAISLSSNTILIEGGMAHIISSMVGIKAELEKPLKLQPIQFTLDKKLKYQIEEIAAGKQYNIVFTTIPNVGNYYQGFLKLKTNYPERPEVMIQIRGRFKG